VGPDRAHVAVALQGLLMRGVRDFAALPAVAALTPRALATAAALDYVLMLATDTAGIRIPAVDAQRAIVDGLGRASDDGVALVRAIAVSDDGRANAYVREALQTLLDVNRDPAIATDDRRFAVITLASDIVGR